MRRARSSSLLALTACLSLMACDSDGDGADGGADLASGSDASVGDGAPGGDGGGDGGPPTMLSCGASDCGPSTGATTMVPMGGDLQAALDAASPGDTLVLPAGATFSGNFVLPAKSGSGCITVRTSASDADLPPGVRVGPGDVAKLARIVSPGGGLPAVRTEPGAHHYRLVGIEIAPATPDALVYSLVALGSSGGDQSSLSQVPHHLVIDRSYVHGWPDKNFKRGIDLNSASTCVLSSHVSEFQSDFQDSQAIGGTNGPGPFRILNNRLEGAGENVMFGGAVPAIADLVPTDIEIRGNHFVKPLAWRSPSAAGYKPIVKNHFEIKNGKQVVFDGNVLDNNWNGADQHGSPILLTPRSEGGSVPWASCEDVRITSNLIRHVGGGVEILGRDSPASQQTKNVTIANNVFEDLRTDYTLDLLRVIQVTGVETLVVDHNTFRYAGGGAYDIVRSYGTQTTGFRYTNNVVPYGTGIWSDCGTNSTALTCSLPGSVVAGNVIIGGAASGLPATSSFPADDAAVGFLDLAGAASDYHGYQLAPTSPYAKQGTDGQDPGFSAATLDAARGTSAAP
jgi:hypothetical protein